MCFTIGLRACCVALTLMLASAPAAEQPPSLVGATREEVLARYGEPRSIIAAGGQEIFFFARERVLLRDGVVVEVEPLAEEAAPRRPAALAPAPSAAAANQAPPTAVDPTVSTEAATLPPTPAAAAPANTTSEAAAPPPPESAPVAEPQFAIKSVRPPAGAYTRPVPRQEPVAAPPAAPAAVAARSAVTAPRAEITPAPRAAPAGSDARATLPARSATVAERTFADSAAPASAPAVEAANRIEPGPPPTATALIAEEPVAPMTAEEQAASTASQRPDELQRTDASDDIFTGRTYLISLLVIIGGGAYLVWGWRQRQLELAASAVSSSPFASAAPLASSTSARFTPELLAKLEAPRFERLIASYYGKTGIVAERTNGGPASPVHIKISWKGESRPFALVQCVAQPPGLVDAQPLQELFAVLNTEDIRRGYVVTSGKFSVAARDFAEEKHLTLLPGDILLEKINALPDSARAELMQEVSASNVAAAS